MNGGKAQIFAILTVSVLALAACQESTLKTGFRGEGGDARPLRFCDVSLSYESVKPIFENRCQRCHQPGTRNSVGSYNEVLRIKDSIHFEVSNDFMPDDGPLAADQKRLMVAWLEAGAPETSSQVLACAPLADAKPTEPPASEPTEPPVTEPDAPPVAEPPVVVTPTPDAPPVTEPPANEPPVPRAPRTYAELREKLLVPKCLNCHSLDGSAMLFDFTDYRSMVGLTEIFDRADPANSVIMQVVLKEGRGQMPPVRSQIPRLTDEEVELLRGWIEDGLLE